MGDWSSTSDGGDRSKHVQLNVEQIHALLGKLSSDETKELTDAMRSCTTEMTMTRGVPVTGAVLGSLYLARTRLPKQYHFGPKGWPFYAIMGIASMTATNFMFMGTCRDRIHPRIQELWNKYKLGSSTVSYDQLRQQNRTGVAPVTQQQQGSRGDYTADLPPIRPYRALPKKVDTPTDRHDDSYEPQSLVDSKTPPATPEFHDPYAVVYEPMKPPSEDPYAFDLSGDKPSSSRRPPPPSFGYDNSSYMSGTPSGANRRDFS